MTEETLHRIDKWLWNVRLFKTRTLAAEACKNNKVLISDIAVKSSRIVKIGDIINIKYNNYTKTINVKNFLRTRGNAALTSQCFDDLTSQDEYEKLKFNKELNFEHRPKGIGRPTKKNRRELDNLKYL